MTTLTPERIHNSIEMRLQVSSEERRGTPSETSASDLSLDDLTSVQTEEEEDSVQEIEEEESIRESLILKTPPAIRRRRKPSKGFSDPTCPLSFITEETGGDLNGEMKFAKKTFLFPTKPSAERLRGINTTPACRAISAMILVILIFCALLSHYTSLEPPQAEEQGTAMTVSEQRILLKAYLGDLEGSSSISNVKLPAGGNPIYLIHLLHSRIEQEEDAPGELSAAGSRLEIRIFVLLVISIMVKWIQ